MQALEELCFSQSRKRDEMEAEAKKLREDNKKLFKIVDLFRSVTPPGHTSQGTSYKERRMIGLEIHKLMRSLALQ